MLGWEAKRNSVLRRGVGVRRVDMVGYVVQDGFKEIPKVVIVGGIEVWNTMLVLCLNGCFLPSDCGPPSDVTQQPITFWSR